MKCDRFKILDYLDNELSEPEAEQLEAHFKSCSQCWRELQEQRALMIELNCLWEIDIPREFSDLIIERARKDLRAAVKSRAERRKALIVALALASVSIFFLTPAGVISYILDSFKSFTPIARFVFNRLEAFAGTYSVISTTAARHFLSDVYLPPAAAVLMVVLLSAFLLYLIIDYHRRRETAKR